ncbi:hypothetical protein LENED_007299 [Lentinula edodes]|uniref:Uncharacterized protein n=1 Tax=Lentinula edodes TaxID=5353 RepID=A0A1Q3EE48_LENED|nr:hypothetical protein LENED_007299 [Lentinula edodes]
MLRDIEASSRPDNSSSESSSPEEYPQRSSSSVSTAYSDPASELPEDGRTGGGRRRPPAPTSDADCADCPGSASVRC